MKLYRGSTGKSPFILYLETTLMLGIIPVLCVLPENQYTLNQRTHVLCQKNTTIIQCVVCFGKTCTCLILYRPAL